MDSSDVGTVKKNDQLIDGGGDDACAVMPHSSKKCI